MLEKFDKLSIQVRILIATVISLLFFIPYSIYLAPSAEELEQEAKIVQSTNIVDDEIAAPIGGEGVVSSPKDSQDSNIPEASENSGDIIAQIYSKNFRIDIDYLGRISQMYLLEGKFLVEGQNLLLFSPLSTPKPLEVRFSDQNLNKEAFEGRYRASVDKITLKDAPQEIELVQELSGGFKIVKTIKFYPNGRYDVKIETNQEKRFFVSPGARPIADEDDFVFKGAIITQSDGTITKIEDGDAKGQEYFIGTKLVANSDRYYTTLLYSDSGFNVATSSDKKGDALLFIESLKSIDLLGYIGPKDHKILNEIEPTLTKAIEYGFITFFAKPLFLLLSWLHDATGNWGWAIVLLTIIVRIVLYPLTHKGMVSMQKLKDIAPKMKELQAKHKGDPQKLQASMMELYKKHGANPLGGCLPMLLQIPVFFAIYRVLYNAIELKGAEWILWFNDLSVMDPYYILPLLMGASMYIHQRMTPTTFTDPMQEQIFRFLPIIFTVFFIFFPAGLVLYWFVNNLASIFQQYVLNKYLEAKKRKAEHNEEK